MAFGHEKRHKVVKQAMGKRITVSTLTWALLAGLAQLACTSPLGAAVVHPPTKLDADLAAQGRRDPETMLFDVYRELEANHLQAAESKAAALVDAFPNFRLGHLIHGDLLLMHTHVVNNLGMAPSGADEKLANLRQEAMARLKSLRERPPTDLIPRSILQLRDDQKHVLLVDARRSRMYVYENQGGQLKLQTDYYVSQGKLGVNKLREGDQKTPLGVYYITSRVPGFKLPDFYGTGALPINYPNEWDKANGRSGSGIWLHGTPSDSFSRPPLSSDGCVVLTNPDLNKLYDSVEIGKTPVVISDHVEFVTRAKWDAERTLAAKLVENWRRDVESMNRQRMLAHYSRHFKASNGDSLEAWFGKQQLPALASANATVELKDPTFFLYPGQEEMIVSTFTQESVIGKSRRTLRKRQYWAHESGQWKIVSEVNL